MCLHCVGPGFALGVISKAREDLVGERELLLMVSQLNFQNRVGTFGTYHVPLKRVELVD